MIATGYPLRGWKRWGNLAANALAVIWACGVDASPGFCTALGVLLGLEYARDFAATAELD